MDRTSRKGLGMIVAERKIREFQSGKAQNRIKPSLLKPQYFSRR